MYAIAESRQAVRNTLETMALEVLKFMTASRLAANPDKTKFVMFGKKDDSDLPIRVGDVEIKESHAEQLLGITFNKGLTWKDHLAVVEPKLRRSTGIIRRLTWHLPRDIVIKMIEPLFTSKLRYALELLTDSVKPDSDTLLKRLHSLHRGAMKAALRISSKEHPSDQELGGVK